MSFSVPPEKVEKVMDQVEKYIMTRLYKYVFCPETTEDEKKDLAVQRRIRFDFRTSFSPLDAGSINICYLLVPG